jgi:hypothetical protein
MLNRILQRELQFVMIKTQGGSETALRITVHNEHPLPAFRKGSTEVKYGRRFPGTTFRNRYSDDPGRCFAFAPGCRLDARRATMIPNESFHFRRANGPMNAITQCYQAPIPGRST